MSSYVLALAAIISGVDVPCSRETLHNVALSLEILDEREMRWWGKPWTGFEAMELQLLHTRYKKLHDAPPVCDAVRFPSRDVCTEIIGFNNAYIRHLEQRKTLFHDEWIDEAISDLKRIIAVYDCVRGCRCDYYYVTARREALQRLRSMLGSRDYYSGTLPPVAPVWHFRRID